ncbi:MAG: hypothetical protein V1813_00350 [Candidatus Aenigmatarchaeota archaeon]
MHAIVKILIGLLLIVAGFGLFVDSVLWNYGGRLTGMSIAWWHNFVVVVTGIIPAFLILIGLFVVWLEADELKAEKEISSEAGTAKEVKEAVASEDKPVRKRGRKKK